MKKNLNEEISRIKSIMGLKEQMDFDGGERIAKDSASDWPQQESYDELLDYLLSELPSKYYSEQMKDAFIKDYNERNEKSPFQNDEEAMKWFDDWVYEWKTEDDRERNNWGPGDVVYGRRLTKADFPSRRKRGDDF